MPRALRREVKRTKLWQVRRNPNIPDPATPSCPTIKPKVFLTNWLTKVAAAAGCGRADQADQSMPPGELSRRQRAIERSLYQMGITFTVYSDSAGTEKIMPFDVVPRVVSSVLWHHIEAGLKQRIQCPQSFLGRHLFANSRSSRKESFPAN